MDVRVRGKGPVRPFETARSRFEAVHDLEKPVTIRIQPDPDVRTMATHEKNRHTLTISEAVARSSLTVELAVHEFAHMRRIEQRHPSHTVDVIEALYLASAGQQLDRETIVQAHQIANHVRDVYADDITFEIAPGEKLAGFLESELAMAIADNPRSGPADGYRRSAFADPTLTAVNAAFALALLDRHDVSTEHRLAELAHAAQTDAPNIDIEVFERYFAGLQPGPSETDCLRTLIDLFEAYFEARAETESKRDQPDQEFLKESTRRSRTLRSEAKEWGK